MGKQGYVKFIENSKPISGDMHLSCLSQCFNLRGAVNEKGNCLTVVETPVSTAAIAITLLTNMYSLKTGTQCCVLFILSFPLTFGREFHPFCPRFPEWQIYLPAVSRSWL